MVFVRAVVALVAIGGLAASVPATQAGPDVRFDGSFETVSATSLGGMLKFKFAALARIDPDRPIDAEADGQTLSLFGREDLIAGVSGDYRAKRCAPLAGSIDVFAAIERAARATSIVIINESHERSQHRGFIAEVARRLRPLGYDGLAIETLANSKPDTPEKSRPSFLRQPGLTYLEDDDGYYLSEAGFGRLGRTAKALGYGLLAYEIIDEGPSPDLTQDQRIAVREEAQATNLAAYLAGKPGAKLLVHVGYSHAAEVPRTDGARFMAARLKEKTGIDPLTISQTTCRGGGDAARLAALPADQPAGTFDLVVDHPTARFERGRPVWRGRTGDRSIDIPRSLRPAAGWRVIEARPVGEPVTSVPMDRVAIRRGEDVVMMLPPGRYRLRAIDVVKPPRASVSKPGR